MWKDFIEKTKNRKPWPLILEAAALQKMHLNKRALDLGCGGGVDSITLAQMGYMVDAIDAEKTMLSVLKDKKNIFPQNRKMEDFDFAAHTYDLVIAWNSLPFLKKKDAISVLKKIKKSLNSNGIFVFSVFASKDDFVKRKRAVAFSAKEVKDLFKGMRFIHFSNIEKEAPAVGGEMKHWHFLTGIIQKP